MSDAVDVDRSSATGWPTISDLSTFTGQPESDADLQWALDAGIDYGNLVLGNRWQGTYMDSVFRACLDYSASIYSARIGQADVMVETYYGSTPLNRYRRVLLANRYTAIA